MLRRASLAWFSGLAALLYVALVSTGSLKSLHDAWACSLPGAASNNVAPAAVQVAVPAVTADPLPASSPPAPPAPAAPAVPSTTSTPSVPFISPCEGRRLVVHVGPHKTGTSSIQAFLFENSRWLRDEWGVTVGYGGGSDGKGGDYVCQAVSARVHGYKPPKAADAAVEYLKSALQQSSLVVFSAEGMSGFDSRDWAVFKSFLETEDLCLSAVVLHRDAPAWISSNWFQWGRYSSTPRSFLTYLSDLTSGRKPDNKGDADPQLQCLNTLKTEFAERVDAASYDYLHQVGCSASAYLICNATLRKTGTAWAQCKDAVEARLPTGKNISPLHATVDVSRLARMLYQAKQATHGRSCRPWPTANGSDPPEKRQEALAMTASSSALIKVAEQLPLTCLAIDGIFKAETDRWFALSGAHRPGPIKPKHRKVCTVDFDNMEPKHWKLIDGLLPPC